MSSRAEPSPPRTDQEGLVNSVFFVRDRKCFPLYSGSGRHFAPGTTLLATQFFGHNTVLEKNEGGPHDYQAGTTCLFKTVFKYVEQLGAKNHQGRYLKLNTRWETSGGRFHLEVALSQKFVEKLREILPRPFLEIMGVVYRGASPEFYKFGKRISLERRERIQRKYVVSDGLLRNDVALRKAMGTWCIPMKLSIVVGWHADARWYPGTAVKLSTDSVLQTLFEDESSKDVTIKVGNGAELKCHRLILGAHSPVLAAMVSPENGMREGQTGLVELRENSEEGMRHFLRFLYCFELETAELGCEVAVELFEMGHKYALPQLEMCLYQLLLRKGKGWYDPEVILELYFQVRNVEDLTELRDHCLLTMRRMTREIKAYEKFKELGEPDRRELFPVRAAKLKRKYEVK